MEARTIRPIDLRFGPNDDLRLITTTNANGSFMVEFLDYSGASTVALGRPVTSFTSYQADTWYHVAGTFETGVDGKTTMSLYLAEGRDAILTSTPATNSVTSSTVSDTTGALPNDYISFANPDAPGAGTVEFDTFRIYDDVPTEFSAIPEPSAFTFLSALMATSLVVSSRSTDRRRSQK